MLSLCLIACVAGCEPPDDGSTNTAYVWAKSYGGDGTDKANAIVPTRDGGYLLVGETDSFGLGGKDLWVAKLDAHGGLVWSRTYGNGIFDDFDGESAVFDLMPDGGFLIAYTVEGTGGHDLGLIRTDSGGRISWRKTYGAPDVNEIAYALRALPDGRAVIVGDKIGTSSRSFVALINAEGDPDWWRAQPGYPDYLRDVALTSDGGFVAVGGKQDWMNHVTGDRLCWTSWILRLDSVGSVLWEHLERPARTCMDRPEREFFTDVVEASDGRIVALGEYVKLSEVLDDGDHDLRVLTYEADGSLWDTVSYGNEDSEEAVGLIAGTDDLRLVVFKDWPSYYLLRVSSSGSVLGVDLIAAEDEVWDVAPDVSGGFFLSGRDSDGAAWMARYDNPAQPSWTLSMTSAVFPPRVRSIVPLPDGALAALLAGEPREVYQDVQLVEVGSDGTLSWARGREPPDDVGRAAVELEDGDFVIVGSTGTLAANDGFEDGWAMRLLPNGAVRWHRALGFPGTDKLTSVDVTSTGNVIAVGYSVLMQTDPVDQVLDPSWVVLLDGDGNVLWDQHLEQQGRDEGEDAVPIVRSAGDGFVVLGTSKLTKLDSSGTALWTATVSPELPRSLAVGGDGSIFVAGVSDFVNGGNRSYRGPVVQKLAADGRVAWDRRFATRGGGGVAHALQATADGGVAGSGTVSLSGSRCGLSTETQDCEDVLVFELDTNGDVLWSRAHRAGGRDMAYAIRSTGDGGFIVAGETSSMTPSIDAWVLKLDESGNVAASCPEGIGESADLRVVLDVTGRPPAAPASARSVDAPLIAELPFTPLRNRGEVAVGHQCFGVVPTRYTLTVDVQGGGRVLVSPQGSDCDDHCRMFAERGESVTLDAEPDPGFRLAAWSGDASCVSGTVVMDRDKTCRATFEIDPDGAVDPPDDASSPDAPFDAATDSGITADAETDGGDAGSDPDAGGVCPGTALPSCTDVGPVILALDDLEVDCASPSWSEAGVSMSLTDTPPEHGPNPCPDTCEAIVGAIGSLWFDGGQLELDPSALGCIPGLVEMDTDGYGGGPSRIALFDGAVLLDEALGDGFYGEQTVSVGAVCGQAPTVIVVQPCSHFLTELRLY